MRKFKDYSKIISHSVCPIEYKDFAKEYREKKDRYDLVYEMIEYEWKGGGKPTKVSGVVSYEWVFKQKSYMKEEYKK